MANIAEDVKAIIVEKLGVDASEVTETASFTNDLGADSLDIVELIMDFEKKFDVEIDDNAFKGIEAIIYSMTPAERSHPEIIQASRRKRIAAGSGTTIQEVNRLLNQFEQTRKAMKAVTKLKNPMKLMGAMRGMKR